MDSPNGSHQITPHWKFCGENIPREEIVYFAQLFICISLIITSVVMLALHDSNREYWMVCVSSSVGYIMPSPRMMHQTPTVKKKTNSPS